MANISRKSSEVTDLLFLEAISSRSFLMSLRHFSISTTFIPSTEETERKMTETRYKYDT